MLQIGRMHEQLYNYDIIIPQKNNIGYVGANAFGLANKIFQSLALKLVRQNLYLKKERAKV